jgi:hypothetical protein
MLHITNGTSVTQTMNAAEIPGEYLSWMDVLHDGPVPGGLSLDELSPIRAQFVAECGWATPIQALRGFEGRNEWLRGFREHNEVVLWFEHDLFDQLQLIQLLDFFHGQDMGATALTLICVGEHPELRPFYGLGQLNASQLTALLPTRTPVMRDQLACGADAWAAFTSDTPEMLRRFVQHPAPGLPFLQTAMKRLLQEYPAANGLGRLENDVLNAIAQGARTKREIYAQSQKQEEVPFGDASVFLRLDTLEKIGAVMKEAGYSLTDFGRELHQGSAAARIEKWIGGVHLTA